MNPRWRCALVLVNVVVCVRAAGAQSTSATVVDSIALERTVCLGACPAYRVSIASSGRVVFEARPPAQAYRAVGTVASPAAWAALAVQVTGAPFQTMPEQITTDRALCRSYMTDAPSVIVNVYRGTTHHQVTDYVGCYLNTGGQVAPRLDSLRALERAIDRLAGVDRWLPAVQRDP